MTTPDPTAPDTANVRTMQSKGGWFTVGCLNLIGFLLIVFSESLIGLPYAFGFSGAASLAVSLLVIEKRWRRP